ncbi:MAG: GAP family protein [Actinobacteria bacterium]|nr:GAP family protein [Actinomycetota bacterium]MCB9390957.1 GAP family protein [Acidimicrobiia bacterium]
MDVALSKVLQNAIGVAISPVPIIAIVLILLSKKRIPNGFAFAFGSLVTLAATSAIAFIANDAATGSDSSGGPSIVQGIVGVLFLFMAYKQWSARPKPGEPGTLPGWMESIQTITPLKAFGLAFLIAITNVKNITLSIATASSLTTAGLTTSQEVWAIVIFVVLGSASIWLPVVAVAIAGDKANGTLTDMRDWLQHNNHAVMTVLFLLLGVQMISNALAA